MNSVQRKAKQRVQGKAKQRLRGKAKQRGKGKVLSVSRFMLPLYDLVGLVKASCPAQGLLRKMLNALLVRPPVNVLISPTNKCNLSCVACARNQWKQELNPPGDMNVPVLQAAEVAFRFARTAILHGSGEPLLGQRFFQLARLARKHRCRSLFHTNATLIDMKMARRIVAAGINEIRPSVDGCQERESRYLRGVSFETIEKGMSRIKQAAAELGIFGPDIVAAFTVSRQNAHELLPLVKKAAELGWDGVFVAQVQPRNGVEPADPDTLRHVFYLASREAARSKIRLMLPPVGPESGGNCTESAGAFGPDSTAVSALEAGWNPCGRPWDTMAILHDGTIMPCCRGLWHGSGTPVLGQIRTSGNGNSSNGNSGNGTSSNGTSGNRTNGKSKTGIWFSLIKAWYGRSARKLRKAHLNGDYPRACRECVSMTNSQVAADLESHAARGQN